MDPAHPHDSLFALAFGEPQDAATLLASALPAHVAAAIDWRTLHRIDAHFVDPNGGDTKGDLLFSAQMGGREVLIYVLLEHKSSQERFAPFQMLRYVVRVLDHHMDQVPRPKSLPPVLPIVFHHGKGPWRAPTSLRPLFQLGELPAPVAAFLLAHQPELHLLLDDVSGQSDEVIERRSLSLVARVSILFLKHLRRAKPHDLERHVLRFRHLLTRLLDDPRGSVILGALCFYTHATTKAPPERVRAVMHRILDPITASTMMNGMQKLILKERTEGRTEGRAEQLLLMLRKRFGALPDDLPYRVNSGSIADLDRWAERILDARSLDEVFADA